MFSHCSIGLPVLRQLVIPSFPSNRVYPNGCEDIVDSSLTFGGQEAQDLVAFKALCAEETIEPQVSRVENNLIILLLLRDLLFCFSFLPAQGSLNLNPWGSGVYRFVLL